MVLTVNKNETLGLSSNNEIRRECGRATTKERLLRKGKKRHLCIKHTKTHTASPVITEK